MFIIILFYQEWNDVNLKWNKSDFGNIEDIRIPPKHIWKPDLLMYNRYKFDSNNTFNIQFNTTQHTQKSNDKNIFVSNKSFNNLYKSLFLVQTKPLMVHTTLMLWWPTRACVPTSPLASSSPPAKLTLLGSHLMNKLVIWSLEAGLTMDSRYITILHILH